MKFFSSKIVTKPISLEDAVKNAKANPLTVRSLDEIIASARQIKTASAHGEVKTEAPKAEAAPTVQIKLAADFVRNQGGGIALDPMAKTEPEIIGLNPSQDSAEIGHGIDKLKFDRTAPKDMVGGTGQALTPEEGAAGFGAKKWETGAYPVKPQDAADALKQKTPMGQIPSAPSKPLGTQAPARPAAPMAAPSARPAMPSPMASSKKQLKIAKNINFTQWAYPKQVVDAWKQHGTVEACVKNVDGQTSDPRTYCSLLRVAASEADKMVKAAAAAKPAKSAKKEEEASAAPIYKKIAKLTGEEQSFLREFFSKIYGNDYVDALLGDY